MLKIVARTSPSKLKENAIRIFAVVIAFVIAALFLKILGYQPLKVYEQMLNGSIDPSYRPAEPVSSNSFLNMLMSLGTNLRFQRTVGKAIPLIILSLGVAVAFKMKFWNIGAEGQFFFGAFGAALVAFEGANLPSVVLIPLMMLSAMFFGGLYALIPGLLKTKLSTNETLVTLMLNYVAVKFISYLQYGPWKDPSAMGAAKIANFPDSGILPKVFGIHIGWIIALILVAIVYIVFNYTKLGYEITVLGESQTTAKYAGMNVTRVTLTAIFISGGLCGIAGMIQASASTSASLSDTLSGGLGFTAVITAWLAKLSPPVIIATSFLFAILMQGSTTLQISLNVPPSVSEILQGIIIFIVLASEFFIKYKVVFKSKKVKGEA